MDVGERKRTPGSPGSVLVLLTPLHMPGGLRKGGSAPSVPDDSFRPASGGRRSGHVSLALTSFTAGLPWVLLKKREQEQALCMARYVRALTVNLEYSVEDVKLASHALVPPYRHGPGFLRVSRFGEEGPLFSPPTVHPLSSPPEGPFGPTLGVCWAMSCSEPTRDESRRRSPSEG